MTDEPVLDHDTARKVAVALFNRVWDLLDAGDARSADATAEMIDAAHASRYLWRTIGGVEQAVVGEWQISRTYAAAGLGAEAVRHAEESLALLRADREPADWVEGSVHEGRVRAYLAVGDVVSARSAYADAQTAIVAIADPQDRALVASQLAELDVDGG